ncbi:UDP-galactose transporter [Scheffersomyces coipomensis]|uniref:UDP-galactose transporter n=1 Tax=Scheffersomyces coipomensis TaxID=1788519 RepID=UPI00315D7A4D
MTQVSKKGSVITLVVCVLGLYGSFLSWSILQERINTKPYGDEYFKAPLIVNITQALFASIVGLIYSLIATRSNPFTIFTHNEKPIAYKLLTSFILISITSSLSSPLGYMSLKHVDYLAFLLAKSCKLIPVMLVHLVFYRTRFPLFKYIVASSITFGVILFTVFHSKKKEKDTLNDGKTVLGMIQLVGSMLLDGLTNSTQDQIFKLNKSSSSIVKVTGAKLMCILNLFVFILSLGYALIFEYDSEITYTVNFIHKYPQVLMNILEFSVFGAIGQIFVFIILEKFDSLILITATVTRKMISMILSVILFGHYLTSLQWCGVGLVFGGIGYEALVKLTSSPKPSSSKETNLHKEKKE